MEGSVAKTLSQEFSRTKIRILGALSKLGKEFGYNPERSGDFSDLEPGKP